MEEEDYLSRQIASGGSPAVTMQDNIKDKATSDVENEGKDFNWGMALMGLGMGLQGRGGDFLKIIENKKAKAEADKAARAKAMMDRADKEAKIKLEQQRYDAEQAKENAVGLAETNDKFITSMGKAVTGTPSEMESKAKMSIAAYNKRTEAYGGKIKKALFNVDGKQIVSDIPIDSDPKIFQAEFNLDKKNRKYTMDDRGTIMNRDENGEFVKTNMTGSFLETYKEEDDLSIDKQALEAYLKENPNKTALDYKIMMKKAGKNSVNVNVNTGVNAPDDANLQHGLDSKIAIDEGDFKFNPQTAMKAEKEMMAILHNDDKKIVSSIRSFKKSEDAVESVYNFLDQEIKNGNYKSGPLDTTRAKVMKYVREYGVGKFIGMDEKQIASSIGMKTNVGDTVVKYIKMISGAAVTNEERAELTDIIFSGEYTDEKSQREALKAFYEKMKRDHYSTAYNYMEYAPYSAGRYISKSKKPTKTNVSSKIKKNPVIVNKKTGKRMQLVNGKWEEM